MNAEIAFPIKPLNATLHCTTPSNQKSNLARSKSSPSSYWGQSKAVILRLFSVEVAAATVDVTTEAKVLFSSMLILQKKRADGQ